MAKLEQLRSEILEELGTDVYNVYDEERHLIPDAVLISVASALIAQFLIGLIDPKQVGAATREKIEQLLNSVKQKKDLGRVSPDKELDNLLNYAKSNPEHLGPKQLAEGERNLLQGMKTLGMSERVASEHAKSISALIESGLRSNQSAGERSA